VSQLTPDGGTPTPVAPSIDRIPTGIPGLDHVTMGGFPRGRVAGLVGIG